MHDFKKSNSGIYLVSIALALGVLATLTKLSRRDSVHLLASTKSEPLIEPVVDPFALHNEAIYLAERGSSLKRRNQLGDLFDKSRVGLATGAISLSAFLIGNDRFRLTTDSMRMLTESWIWLGVALMTSVLTVLLASFSHERLIAILDDDRRAGLGMSRTLANRTDFWKLWLIALHLISLVSLTCGLTLLLTSFSKVLGYNAH